MVGLHISPFTYNTSEYDVLYCSGNKIYQWNSPYMTFLLPDLVYWNEFQDIIKFLGFASVSVKFCGKSPMFYNSAYCIESSHVGVIGSVSVSRFY